MFESKMNREEQIKINILNEAQDIAEGKGLGYSNDPLEISVARDLVYEELVVGHESDSGHGVIIMGIRDAGLKYLDAQKPHKRAISKLKKMMFVLYSMLLVALGYILNLDSVKTFFSDLIGGALK